LNGFTALPLNKHSCKKAIRVHGAAHKNGAITHIYFSAEHRRFLRKIALRELMRRNAQSFSIYLRLLL
jgi:hypothetical protein